MLEWKRTECKYSHAIALRELKWITSLNAFVSSAPMQQKGSTTFILSVIFPVVSKISTYAFRILMQIKGVLKCYYALQKYFMLVLNKLSALFQQEEIPHWIFFEFLSVFVTVLFFFLFIEHFHETPIICITGSAWLSEKLARFCSKVSMTSVIAIPIYNQTLFF